MDSLNETSYTTMTGTTIEPSTSTPTLLSLLLNHTINDSLTTIYEPSTMEPLTTLTTIATTLFSGPRNVTSSTSNHKVNSFVPAIIHFTYYELNFFDIVFIACIFFLKFFITSLFIIFALVSINNNSYPQLLQRATESHRMSMGPGRGPPGSPPPGGSPTPGSGRRDLLFTVAALNIISGNIQALLDYISTLQRFLYCTSWREKVGVFRKLWGGVGRVLGIGSRTQETRFLAAATANGTNGSKIHQIETLTPTVVFIDSEPGIEVKEIEESLDSPTGVNPLPILYKPTLKIRVKNTQDGTSTIVRALLDPNSICSYISDSVVQNLRFRKYFVWPCFFRCFPGPKCKYVYQATTVVLQSLEQPSEDNEDESPNIPRTSDPVELLIPTQRVSFGSPPPRPSRRLQELIQNACGIQLSDRDHLEAESTFEHGSENLTHLNGNLTGTPIPTPNTSDPPEIGLVLGQDLLYSTVLAGQNPHKAVIVDQDLMLVKTAYGWVANGSTPSTDPPPQSEMKIFSVETESFGILEKDYHLERKRCTETMRILCCPMQILVSLLVLIIYIIIPYIDALLYLYNILFHLAIAFALAQILSLVLGPCLALLQSLIAWRLEVTFHLVKVNIFRCYHLLSRPLLLCYRWLLGGVWVSLYWFLSMGKALFNQWNYSILESEHSVRFSGNFLLRFEGEVIQVKLDPSLDQSSISSQLIRSYQSGEYFWVRLDGDHVTFQVKGQEVKLWISADEESVIVLGSDVLDSTGDPNRFFGHVIRNVLLLRTDISGSCKPLELIPVHGSSGQGSTGHSSSCHGSAGHSSSGHTGSMVHSVPIVHYGSTVHGSPGHGSSGHGSSGHGSSGHGSTFRTRPRAASTISEEDEHDLEGQPWILEHRFYPHGWRQIITCRYWFHRLNFIYLLFFIVYSFLLAVVYFCLIAPYELTLISVRPTMFRYIGNFIFYSSRL